MSAKKTFQRWSWVLMIAFFAAGILISPLFGWLALVCMVSPVIVARWKGRYWCGWICPRGSFFDNIVGRYLRKRKIPAWLKQPAARWIVFTLLMGFITYRFIRVWGDLAAMGGVLLLAVILTTVVGIVLGLIYHQRTWCAICPMGTLASVLGKGKQPLAISTDCVSCNVCTTVCPSQISIADYREKGFIDDGDCLKCERCIPVCRRGAISSEDSI